MLQVKLHKMVQVSNKQMQISLCGCIFPKHLFNNTKTGKKNYILNFEAPIGMPPCHHNHAQNIFVEFIIS